MNKFAWLKAAQSDEALTDRDFRLAVLIAVAYTRGDGVGWAVELDEIAAALPGGLSRRRLTDALRRLSDRGYLVETGRSGGGRAQRARRSFDLRKPPTPASTVYDETPDASGTGLEVETPDASVRNPGQQRPKPLTAASTKTPVELHEQPPTGITTGTSTGGPARGPFGPRCPEHLNDPNPPKCPACRDARLASESQQQAEAQRIELERTAIRDQIDACPACDVYGRLDDLTPCPEHPNFLSRSSA